MVLVLTRKDLEAIMNMKECIEAVEDGFKKLSLGEVVMPKRSVVSIKNRGLFLLMPAYIEKLNVLSTKIVTDYPENPLKQNLPTVQAWILYFNPINGVLEAIMDGVFLTAMRTGAAGGVAAKYLAREDSEVVGVFGTGVQSKTQILALKEVRNIKEVKAYDIYPEKCKKFCEEISKLLNLKTVPCNEPKEVVFNSDIIITATTSKTPVFDGDWIKEGTHITSIGGVGCQELDEKTIKRAKLVVDNREAVLEEASDIIMPIKKGIITEGHIYAEIGEIALGKKAGRINDKEVTIFRTVGVAVEDAVTVKKVYEKAKEKNIGVTVEI
jgi:ornithine cyclodeaminase/alanine dehydrogenase